jgi:hypothetical protein
MAVPVNTGLAHSPHTRARYCFIHPDAAGFQRTSASIACLRACCGRSDTFTALMTHTQ